MSRENVEVVRRLYDAVARRDDATVFEIYDPNVEFDYRRGPGADVVTHTVHRGHEGLRQFFRDWSEAFERYEFELVDLTDAGQAVISSGGARGRGRASGAEVQMRQFAAWTVKEGRVVRVAWFRTREEALEAVGLRD